MILLDLTMCAVDEYERSRAFNGEANCVCSHYLRHVGRFQNNKMRKLLIEVDHHDFLLKQIDLDIWMIQTSFPFEVYWKQSDTDRKRMILDALHDAILKVASTFNWKPAVFKNAYDVVLREKLVNEFHVGKPKASPNRQFRAQVRCAFDLDGIRLFLDISDKSGGTVSSRFIRKTLPHEIFVNDLIGKVTWHNNTEAVLLSRSGDKVGSVRIHDS